MHPVSADLERSDALFALQIRVARRADELARAQAPGSGLNLVCWLVAEAEILGRLPEYHAPGLPVAHVRRLARSSVDS